MDSLRTARVVVIDDDPNEAMPLIRAMGRLGIGCVYISGQSESDLPDEPFTGIRIAFVDMDLEVGGFGGDRTKAIVGKTVTVFRKTVSKECSPCLIVAWTKHPDVAIAFQSAIAQELPGLVHGFVMNLEKPPTFDFDEEYQQELVKKVREFIEARWPIPALWAWEQAAHDAASGVTGLVTQVASAHHQWDGNEEEWLRGLSSALRALINASGGKVVTPEVAERHLCESLNSLHLDVLEGSFGVSSISRVNELLSAEDLAQEAKVSFNTSMLLSRPNGSTKIVRPGNVYLMKCGNNARKAVPGILVQGRTLAADYNIAWPSDEKYNKLNKEFEKVRQRVDSDEHQIAAALRALEKHKRKLLPTLLKECELALVELTPACDFAQDKRKMANFVAGLLVPESRLNNFKGCEAPYYYRTKRIQPPGLDGVWQLLLNSHFLYSCPVPIAEMGDPDFQIRHQLITSLQHWLAAQASRPGLLVVD